MRTIQVFLFALLFALSAQAQNIGDYDIRQKATLSLDTDSMFVYRGDTIPVLDISYHEWSVDSVTWTKAKPEGAKYLRLSNDVKENWYVVNLLDSYWLNDSIYIYNNEDYGTRVYINTELVDSFDLNVGGDINTYGYIFIDKDSLNHTNIYNGGAVAGMYLVASGDTAVWQNLPSGFGETNLARNVNSRGVGVFEQKTDTVLDFRGIASLTDLLTVNLNSGDSTIDLDLSLKTITAGTGITGGGSMEDDVTLNWSVPSLPVFGGTVDKETDWFPFYDVSSGSHYRLHADDFLSEIDLTWFRYPTYGIMTIGSGTGDTIPAVNDTYAGLMLPEDKAKIDTIDSTFVSNIYIESDTVFNIDRFYYTIGDVNYEITHVFRGDGLQQGGIVSWISGLTFSATPAACYINGIFYSTTTAETVTLSVADATYDRIDVIAVDTVPQIIVIEGTPSANPQKPSVDPQLYVELTQILVKATATEPSNPGTGDPVESVVVYDENVEWTTSASGVTASFTQTTTVYNGTYAIEVTGIENNDYLSFSSTAVDVAGLETFSAAINMKEPLLKQHAMYASFWLNGVQVSNEVRFLGYYPNTWEIISLALIEFQFTATQFDEIRLRWAKSGAPTAYTGFYMDYITLQGGITQPVTQTYQTLSTNGEAGNISISDGNSITLNVNDADADSTNELQTLSLNGELLEISDGNSVDLGLIIPDSTNYWSKTEITEADTTRWGTDASTTNELITAVTYASDTLTITEAGTEHKVEITAGGSSFWTADTYGINYQAGDVAVGTDNQSFSRFHVNTTDKTQAILGYNSSTTDGTYGVVGFGRTGVYGHTSYSQGYGGYFVSDEWAGRGVYARGGYYGAFLSAEQ